MELHDSGKRLVSVCSVGVKDVKRGGLTWVGVEMEIWRMKGMDDRFFEWWWGGGKSMMLQGMFNIVIFFIPAIA